MEAIKEQCDLLIADDALDKEKSLGILRVQHAIETLFLNEQHDHATELLQLQNDIQKKSIPSDIKSDIDQMGKRIHQLHETINHLISRINEVTIAKKK